MQHITRLRMSRVAAVLAVLTIAGAVGLVLIGGSMVMAVILAVTGLSNVGLSLTNMRDARRRMT